MRNRTYGGVRGRKTKVGEKYFVFLLLDFCRFAPRFDALRLRYLAYRLKRTDALRPDDLTAEGQA